MSPDELQALVLGYIEQVRSGRRVVGRLERLAVERHAADLARPDYGTAIRFDEARALHILRFATRYIRHTKGEWAGRPYRFDRQSAWMAFLLWALFGWQARQLDGKWYRRFRSAYVSVARKNGKTVLSAIVALYMLAFDCEPGAEVYFAATKRDQAKIGWRQAADFIRRSRDREFRGLFRVIRSTSHLSVDDDAVCIALGRDADTLDGLNPHLGVIDELHAHRTRDTWDVIESGMAARRQPLILGITTAGASATGLCWDADRDAQRILQGVLEDDTLFAFIARLDPGDDWADESVWCKANPNLGVSVQLDKLRSDCRKAKNNPAYLGEFRRKRCNEWVSASTVWLPVEAWNACERPIGLDDLGGLELFAAVDLAKWHDFVALVVVGRRGEEYLVWPFFWFPEAGIAERVKETRVPVDVWRDRGLVSATPGEITDQDYIVERLQQLRATQRVAEVPLDPREAWKLATDLQKLGFSVTESNQGYWLSGAMKETERLVREKKLVHNGDPVLRWMISNVVATTNEQGRIKPDKKRSGDCIDGAVALIMAVGRAVAYQPREVQFYFSEG